MPHRDPLFALLTRYAQLRHRIEEAGLVVPASLPPRSLAEALSAVLRLERVLAQPPQRPASAPDPEADAMVMVQETSEEAAGASGEAPSTKVLTAGDLLRALAFPAAGATLRLDPLR